MIFVDERQTSSDAQQESPPLLPVAARHFATIPDCSNYLVGRNGRVFSLSRGRFLKPWKHASGHLYLALRTDRGDKVHVQVHQLVLMTFVGPPKPGEECCHRDGNPENNCLANLRWAPRAENIKDYQRLHGQHWASRLTNAQAEAIRSEYTGKRGDQAFLAEKYGVSRYVINDLVHGKTYKGVAP